jgi:GNAT superfamily N-acetyltransferase
VHAYDDSAPGAERVVLRDGSPVTTRLLTAGDEAAIGSWFAGLGAETRYARFFAWLEQLDERLQAALALVDHADYEAGTAIGPDGATIGIARYMRSAEPISAEVAVAVADDWRGKGVASILLQRLAARARAAGIESFVALCLATNHAVIRALSRLGPTTVSPPDTGVVEVRIDLTGDSPSAGRGAGRPDELDDRVKEEPCLTQLAV